MEGESKRRLGKDAENQYLYNKSFDDEFGITHFSIFRNFRILLSLLHIKMIEGKVAVYLCLHALTTKLDHIVYVISGEALFCYKN